MLKRIVLLAATLGLLAVPVQAANTYWTAARVNSCNTALGVLPIGIHVCDILSSQEDAYVGVGGGALIGIPTASNCTATTVTGCLSTELTTNGTDSATRLGAATVGLLATATTIRAQFNEICTSGTDGLDNIGAAATGLLLTATTARAQVAELTTSGTDAADNLGSAATAPFTTATTLRATLGEIGTNITQTTVIPISITSLDQIGGAATSAYANGVSPGFSQIGGKEVVFKADGDISVAFSIALPFNWSTAAWEVHAMVLGDAAGENIDVECWLSKANDLGNTDAITTAAAATTATHAEYVFVAQDEATYAAANGAVSFQPEAANPVFMTCEITLDQTDFDMELYSLWIEYTPEI